MRSGQASFRSSACRLAWSSLSLHNACGSSFSMLMLRRLLAALDLQDNAQHILAALQCASISQK